MVKVIITNIYIYIYIKQSLTEVFSKTMHRTVTHDSILDSSTNGMVDGPIQILI